MKTATATIMVLLAGVVLAAGPGRREAAGAQTGTVRIYSVTTGQFADLPPVEKTPKEWRAILTDQQYHILREEGTERAFTGKLWDNKRQGIYRCAGCGTDLFSSQTKYESGTGWPSFWQPVAPENIREVPDNSFFIRRTEVECARCGGHLGHVFTDGPRPTGLRYCINSASLAFVEGVDDKTQMPEEK